MAVGGDGGEKFAMVGVKTASTAIETPVTLRSIMSVLLRLLVMLAVSTCDRDAGDAQELHVCAARAAHHAGQCRLH